MPWPYSEKNKKTRQAASVCVRHLQTWQTLKISGFGVKRTLLDRVRCAFDAVDGASSAVAKCYSSCVESESDQGGETTANLGAEALNELARTRRRRNADKVDPGIGRTRLGQRIFECVVLIGTRSAREHYGQRLHRRTNRPDT